jgi:hypothetical protein
VSLLAGYEDLDGQIEEFLMDLASTEESFFCDNLVDLVGEAGVLSPFQQIQTLLQSSLYEVVRYFCASDDHIFRWTIVQFLIFWNCFWGMVAGKA